LNERYNLVEIENYLTKRYKRKYIRKKIDVQELLEKQDRKTFGKVERLEQHPLRNLFPKYKNTKYKLRNRSSYKSKITTDRFKNSYINSLVFKHNLAL
jgi:hypothetical protein